MAYFALFKILWLYTSHHNRWKIVLYICLHVLSQGAMVFVPLVFAQVLNVIQLSEKDQMINGILPYIFIWAGIVTWFNVSHRIARYYEYDVAFDVKQNFLLKHYHIVSNMPLSWHNDNHSGNVISRIQTAGGALEDFAHFQYAYIPCIVNFFGPMIALSILSWKIAVFVFCFSCFTIWMISRFDKAFVTSIFTHNEITHNISAKLFDFISNIKTIITLRLSQKTYDDFARTITPARSSMMHAYAKVNGAKWFLLVMMNMIMQLCVIFYYVWQKTLSHSQVLIGNIAAIFQYVGQITGTFGQFAQYYQQNLKQLSDFRSVETITHAYNDIPNPDYSLPDSLPEQWAGIQLSEINFSYQNKRDEKGELAPMPNPVALHDVSFTINRGDRIAIIGESGAGKSTIMALMRGLFIADTGKCAFLDNKGNLLYGCDDLSPLWAMTSFVPQEPEIFENTIGYNIHMNMGYSDSDMAQAVSIAKFDDVLCDLPNAMDTDMRERGVTLSGGQRQRLALARGILASGESDIILLDEPTSSVDMKNEEIIYQTLFKTFTDKTFISSIHRLHLLPLFDKIIVIRKGRIVAMGSYNDVKAFI